MNTLGDRIRERLAAKGMTFQDLADAVGVTSSAVSQWVTNDSKKPRNSNMPKLASALGVSIMWLLTGTDGQSVITYEDNEVLPEGYVQIPTYKVSFSAGTGVEPTWEEIHTVRPAAFHRSFFEKMGVDPANCFRVPVIGDSMEPLIHDGDYVTVDKSPAPITDGAVYCIADRDGTRVKRLSKTLKGSLIIQSDNPKYADEILEGDEIETVKVLGRVIERSGLI